MHITQESDYAIRIVYCLAKSSARRDARGISEEINVSLRFSLKILGKLVQSGIVTSFKGNRGGYELARPASDRGGGRGVLLLPLPERRERLLQPRRVGFLRIPARFCRDLGGCEPETGFGQLRTAGRGRVGLKDQKSVHGAWRFVSGFFSFRKFAAEGKKVLTSSKI